MTGKKIRSTDLQVMKRGFFGVPVEGADYPTAKVARIEDEAHLQNSDLLSRMLPDSIVMVREYATKEISQDR